MKKYLLLTLILILIAGAIALGPDSSGDPPHPKTVKNPVDGAIMIYIPPGEFIAGGIGGADKARVYLDEYYIYKYEVTNDQFARFIEETGYTPQGSWCRWVGPETGSHPVVMVSWNDADAYCRWAGVRLPTEAQWEKAARGTDGRKYPWGDSWDPSLCNNRDTPAELLEGRARYLFEKTGITPVGSFSGDSSPFGVMDMAGNASEWTADWFGDEYPGLFPGSPPDGTDKVLRGGSFYQDPSSCRLDHRDDNLPDSSDVDYTFRGVWLPSDPLPRQGVIPRSSPRPDPVAVKLSPEDAPAPDIQKIPDSNRAINQRDGAEMIYIPGGSFVMGASPADRDARPQELPRRRVTLSPYYIYKYEVTYRQFEEFTRQTGYVSQGSWKEYLNPAVMDHPVVYVTWEDARAYCLWAGGDLPTEAQWERAARGGDERIYPWGDEWAPNFANVLELTDPEGLALRYIYYDNLGTTPVGSFPMDRSPEGLMDVAGNVIEWCRDWYNPEYYRTGPTRDPSGPDQGQHRVMRGGGWGQDQRICRLTYRDRQRPGDVDGDFGFRAVVEIPPEAVRDTDEKEDREKGMDYD